MQPPPSDVTVKTTLGSELGREFVPRQLLRSIIAGGLLYFLEFAIILSYAVLIFSGELSSFAPAGIMLIVVGDIVLLLIMALLSSYPGTIAIGQDPAAIILSVAAASVAAATIAADPQVRFATVVVMIVLTTLITGLFFLALGKFKLGGLARYLPYPVMGGFLAGTGWLLVVGGLDLVTDGTGITFAGLFAPGAMMQWVPALLLGVMIYVASRRSSNPFIVPGLILGAALLFFGLAAIAGFTTAQLAEAGWLLGAFPAGTLWQFPLSPQLLSATDWSVLVDHTGLLAPVMIVSVIGLLLNANGMELSLRRDIDLNHELSAAGVANLAAGLAGGMTGYHSISMSNLNHTLSGGRRLPAIIMVILMVATLVLGTGLLGLVPRFVLGALVIEVGLALLVEWVYEAWFKFSRIDFVIIVLIAVVIATRGFLEGIFIGLVATIVMFVVSYSRSDVVKHRLTGTTFRSRVTRGPDEQAILNEVGNQLYILQLQGFIFFGTANSLFERVKEHAAHETTRIVLFDFSRVTGLDSTGLLSFDKMLQVAEGEDVMLVLTGLPDDVGDRFRRGGYNELPGRLRIFPTLDEGVEWSEEQLLVAAGNSDESGRTLVDYLSDLCTADDVATIVAHMTRREVESGTYLIRQGDQADNMFFVESGQVTAQRELPGEDPVRLETMHGGRVVGELGFYLGIHRSAAVVADTDSVVYVLTHEDMQRMEQNDPEAANAFHRIIVRLIGERTFHLIRALDALEG